jgi:hypothetical protein
MSESAAVSDGAKGPTYYIDLEGIGIKEWHSSTITVPEIRDLAGWDSTQPVLEVDLETNTEVTLADDAIVQLKPGQGFAKKVQFKRG